MTGVDGQLPLVRLREVVRAYQTPTGMFQALRGVDLDVDAGEFVAVIGKSGSGKSTLINMIAGIDRPTGGEVHVAGTAVQDLNENAVAAWRGGNLGVIFQFFQLLPTLTLLENVVLPMELARLGSSHERRDRGLYLLERVEMGDHAAKLPFEVSGGQQQRVAIARALANDPALIVADEPTGSLDSHTADKIFRLFEDLVDHGKTILMVTHDNDLATRASRVVLIADGEIVESQVRSTFVGLSEKALSEVSANLEPQVLAAGSTVFAEGDVADRFYIVIRGTLEVLRRRSTGDEDVVAVLGLGEYFGEAGLLQQARRNATVRVSNDSEASLLALDGDIFRRLVAENQMTHDRIAAEMRRRMTTETLRNVVPSDLHVRLDELTSHAVRRIFQPGAAIIESGGPSNEFYVVLQGAVEVMAGDGKSVAYRYRSGRHFTAGALGGGGRTIGLVRAAPEEKDGTTVVTIPMSVHGEMRIDTGFDDDHIAVLLRERARK